MPDKRTILIAGMGTSPAVLTETVWALCHQKNPMVPDEVVVLVTKSGKERLCEELLLGEKPVWEQMLAALKKEKIKIDGKLAKGCPTKDLHAKLVELHNGHSDTRCDWLDTFREGSRFANIDDIDDLRKTLSELRKKLQAAGFANAEALVPQQGVGRGVVYAFCEMHNKCTKCTTDILRNKSPKRKTARKTGGIAAKSASHRQANAVAKTTLQTTTKTTTQTTTQIPISSATRHVLDLLKAEPLLSGDKAAQRLGLTRDGFYYHVKILRKAVGLRHTGGTKRGRWEVVKS